MAEMFIGELAAELELNPRTLRYYEALGLLPAPARTMSGYRVYDEDTVQRLAFIIKPRAWGSPSRKLGKFLLCARAVSCPAPRYSKCSRSMPNGSTAK